MLSTLLDIKVIHIARDALLKPHAMVIHNSARVDVHILCGKPPEKSGVHQSLLGRNIGLKSFFMVFSAFSPPSLEVAQSFSRPAGLEDQYFQNS
ncbi:hypothetical protein [Comamonas sp. GB3 AK4-5]|uniref:hypothetical protein n=1 Tax=Comamonas sp. GB3 AK4-5 TaxID=3231487 RepID=UPI00351F1E6E